MGMEEVWVRESVDDKTCGLDTVRGNRTGRWGLAPENTASRLISLESTESTWRKEYRSCCLLEALMALIGFLHHSLRMH